jgi:hypothetical protein
MNRILSALLSFLFFFNSQSQVLTPVKWHYEPSQKEAKAGQTLDLVFYADIEPNWYLYSSDFDPDLGPMLLPFNSAHIPAMP